VYIFNPLSYKRGGEGNKSRTDEARKRGKNRKRRKSYKKEKPEDYVVLKRLSRRPRLFSFCFSLYKTRGEQSVLSSPASALPPLALHTLSHLGLDNDKRVLQENVQYNAGPWGVEEGEG